MEQEQKQAIQELSALLTENNLSEIEYEANGVRLRVVRGGAPVAAPSPAISVSSPAVQPAEHKQESQLVSPMVGVVYLAPDEKAPAFVRVGDKVSVGQTVCLIEAMKTFNPIKSDKAGRIAEILVENGSPVEYNQPLFRVE